MGEQRERPELAEAVPDSGESGESGAEGPDVREAGGGEPVPESGSVAPDSVDGRDAVGSDPDSSVGSGVAVAGGVSSESGVSAGPAGGVAAWWSRFTPTQVLVALLLGLLGFTFTVQARIVADDPAAAALGQEDLVRILANLDAHEERLRQDISELQETHRRLTTAGESQQEALAEARRRADELGILAGTLPVTGPGVRVRLGGPAGVIDAATLVDTVQELRSAGAEAMQVAGARGAVVRVVAATSFQDRLEGMFVDGELLTGPYTLTVVGDPRTLVPALHIPGGVVESVQGDGGTVTVQEEPGSVEVTAVREPPSLRHARPDS